MEKEVLDILEHLVRHARGYATIAERDAHLHLLADLRKALQPAAAGKGGA